MVRDGRLKQLRMNVRFASTLVDRVLAGSPADQAGVKPFDVFVSIEGVEVHDPQDVKDTTQFMAQTVEALTYVFEREGEEMTFQITPDETGIIGVALSSMKKTHAFDGEFYETFVSSSVLDVAERRVGLLKAPFEAFTEIKQVSVLTARMMGSVFADIFSSGEVPDSVAGPVGIAQMTHVSVQNGFMDVIRFAAILSLSLGVLNILPFPALDGGRFVFIVYEAITGHKLNQKFEAMIHSIGFAVLLLLIVLITWNDIARLF